MPVTNSPTESCCNLDVPSVHIEFSKSDRQTILRRFDKCLRTGYLSQGHAVEEFEAAFAAYTGARYAVAVSSGSMAIEIAMRLLNVQHKIVLVPANAFFATAVGPIRAGAELRLVDIDPLTLSPSLDALEAAWEPDVTGLIVVHMGGIVSPCIAAIRAWCDAKGIWLFEDCAHAHGSRLDGCHAGRFGVAGAFSFFATKVITGGEGGMLITDGDEFANEARLHRNLGKLDAWGSTHLRLGTNGRITEVGALIGLVQLRRLDEFIALRQMIAEQYTDRLRNCAAVRPILPAGCSSWYKYPVLILHDFDRQELKLALRDRGIQLAGEIYERPLHQQPALAHLFFGQHFQNAEDVCRCHICLPIHTAMSGAQVDYVVGTIRQLLAA